MTLSGHRFDLPRGNGIGPLKLEHQATFIVSVLLDANRYFVRRRGQRVG